MLFSLIFLFIVTMASARVPRQLDSNTKMILSPRSRLGRFEPNHKAIDLERNKDLSSIRTEALQYLDQMQRLLYAKLKHKRALLRANMYPRGFKHYGIHPMGFRYFVGYQRPHYKYLPPYPRHRPASPNVPNRYLPPNVETHPIDTPSVPPPQKPTVTVDEVTVTVHDPPRTNGGNDAENTGQSVNMVNIVPKVPPPEVPVQRPLPPPTPHNHPVDIHPIHIPPVIINPLQPPVQTTVHFDPVLPTVQRPTIHIHPESHPNQTPIHIHPVQAPKTPVQVPIHFHPLQTPIQTPIHLHPVQTPVQTPIHLHPVQTPVQTSVQTPVHLHPVQTPVQTPVHLHPISNPTLFQPQFLRQFIQTNPYLIPFGAQPNPLPVFPQQELLPAVPQSPFLRLPPLTVNSLNNVVRPVFQTAIPLGTTLQVAPPNLIPAPKPALPALPAVPIQPTNVQIRPGNSVQISHSATFPKTPFIQNIPPKLVPVPGFSGPIVPNQISQLIPVNNPQVPFQFLPAPQPGLIPVQSNQIPILRTNIGLPLTPAVPNGHIPSSIHPPAITLEPPFIKHREELPYKH